MDTADAAATADHFIYVTQVYFCAMYAVVVWDWLISLPREYRFIWATHWTPVKIAYLFCRYWIIIVVPYLLYCFVLNHTRETCEMIYKIPVALAMWNQVGSESVLLIRTYAFFSRNIYVLLFLCSALSGVVAYQLYVDTTQMLLLPFFKPPFVRDIVHSAAWFLFKLVVGLGPLFPYVKASFSSLTWFFRVFSLSLDLTASNNLDSKIAPLLFDTVVTFMTVLKAFTIRRRNGGPNSRLIQTFLHEGVFYYILISIANLINGVFYLQPRQVISAINIPLSVMMAPVLACRLILDLRERGSETVSHSEGTGIAAFTTKSIPADGSPYTPPGNRSGNGRFRRSRGMVSSVSSNLVLTTLGSVHVYPETDVDQDAAEMDDIKFSMDLDLGRLRAAVGGDDGEPIPDTGRQISSLDSVYPSLDAGFKGRTPDPTIEEGLRGIRVDIEKATSTR